MNSIYTIGIGKRALAEALATLREFQIDNLVDVRSSPYSKYTTDFNRENLARECATTAIKYTFMGDGLGGFPTSPEVLTAGKVDYTKLAAQPEFKAYLRQLIQWTENGRHVAMICAEGKPEECHRAKCIAVELTKQGIDVLHIDADNKLVSQQIAMARIDNGQTELLGFEAPLHSQRTWKPR
jgi:uncharacterized protein (DUF488 family)